MTIEHDQHMREALKEARNAMSNGEIPVGSVLVAGSNIIGRGQTQVKRQDSIAAHGELFLILEARGAIFRCERPLVLFTTLEPCLMCLGAMMQAGVDRVVFGMKAGPDGGTRYVREIAAQNQIAPDVVGGVLEDEQVQLMKDYLMASPTSPGAPYVRELLGFY